MLTSRNRIYVPNQNFVKQLILNEFHTKPYVAHLGYQKLLSAIRKGYLWPVLRKYIIVYLNKCLECQLVKMEQQHPIGLLQPMPILEWKWETITLYFITGLPCTKKQ